MPLNDHNSIELVPTTTKVPAPFAGLDFKQKEARPITEAASSKSIY
mgnify:CR=1 FL=1